MTTTELTIETLAATYSRCFEQGTRPDGTNFRKVKDGSPEALTDLIRTAHDGTLPDDHKYRFVEEALDAISEDGEDAQVEADTYTSDLTAWLHSGANRLGYCDQAVKDCGIPDGGLVEILMAGQYLEKGEVLGFVLMSLRANVEEAA